MTDKILLLMENNRFPKKEMYKSLQAEIRKHIRMAKENYTEICIDFEEISI